jgi:hypothetical protein
LLRATTTHDKLHITLWPSCVIGSECYGSNRERLG